MEGIGSLVVTALGIIGVIVALVVFVVIISFLNIWIQARFSGPSSSVEGEIAKSLAGEAA